MTSPPLQHLAVIMDGNRRWAKKKGFPAVLGHATGAKRLKELVEACADRDIKHLTLFAFSTENWQRSSEEVSGLMSLMIFQMRREIKFMHQRGVRFKLAGDISRFEPALRKLFEDAELLTESNTRITVNFAANYGGRWDVVQAVQNWWRENPEADPSMLDEVVLGRHLITTHSPDVDMLIRTGGECRISNFLLWQSAYAELYFSDLLWPEFTAKELDRSLNWFSGRDRRFGVDSGHSFQ